MTLSGGMKRRVLIAKALATSRRSCSSTSPPPASTWSCARTCGRWCARCAHAGVTIILTTHYIEEAEEMADRIGVINKGELILVEDKAELMRKLGKKQLTLHLHKKLDAIPEALAAHRLALANDGTELVYTYDTQGERTGITALLGDLEQGRHPLPRPARPRKARSRTSSSAWWGRDHEPQPSRRPRHLHASRWRAPGAR